MTTEIMKFKEFKVATAKKDEISEVMAELGSSSLSEFDLEKVKFPSQDETEWKVPDITSKSGFERVDEIIGVIVYRHDSRSYWKSTYDENPDQPPDCASTDGVKGEFEIPAFKTEAEMPSGKCGEGNCQYSEFGTAAKGQGQACKLMCNLFMLLPNKILPVLVSVGPGSYLATKKFFLNLLSNGVSSARVMVGLSLVTVKNQEGIQYPKLQMRVVENLSDDMQKVVRGYKAEIEKHF